MVRGGVVAEVPPLPQGSLASPMDALGKLLLPLQTLVPPILTNVKFRVAKSMSISEMTALPVPLFFTVKLHVVDDPLDG